MTSTRIPSLPKQLLQLLAVLIGLAICGCNQPTNSEQSSKEEQAFIGYWMTALNLVRTIDSVRTVNDFTNPPRLATSDPGVTPKPMNEIIEELCNQLEARKSEYSNIPEEIRTQLTQKHHDLISSVVETQKKVEQHQRSSKVIPPAVWNRMHSLLRMTSNS